MADNEDLSVSAGYKATASSRPEAPKLQVSDLEFHKQLGMGSYGIVYKVTFKTPYYDINEAAAKCIAEVDMKEEAKLMKNIDHPNIVKLYDVLDDRLASKILLLEYAPNGTVRDYLTQHQGSQTP
ncbi:aurora/IPL1-related protein kinase 2-like [Amphiura filiformis]|uniref:aurora/IPL1-related protein kinase 2-like n=1 Tax=Amphiura filiformis TaxID=82378 RepID=UPI003B2157A2